MARKYEMTAKRITRDKKLKNWSKRVDIVIRLIKGERQIDVANSLGLTKQRINQIHKELMPMKVKDLIKHMKEENEN